MAHFGLLLPDEGPDAGVAAKLEMGKPIAFLPATKTVENGEELEVFGIKLQFFTEYISDDYNLTVWVPEKNAVLKLDGKTWSKLYLSSTTLGEAISSGKVKVEGKQKEVAVIFDMFDKFNPTKNYRVPSVED